MAFFDPTRPAYRANPYPALAELRRREPVHWSAGINAWVCTRFAECAEVLHDGRRFTSDPACTTGPRAEAITAHRAAMPLGNDPTLGTTSGTTHRRLRGIVNPVFTPAAVRALRPSIDAIAEELAGALPLGEPFELMEEFANPLPRRVMLKVMGFPAEEGERMQRLFSTIEAVRSNAGGAARAVEARAAGDGARAFLEAHAGGELEGESVLGALLCATAREGMAVDEVASIAAHIGAVGTGPTSGAIGNAALALAAAPRVLSELREHPECTRAAAHELMRYDSPTHMVARFAVVETVLGGRRVRRGDAVLAMVSAANRDPAVFASPDEIDLGRDARRQLGFGQGEHICLGGPLGLAIVEAALGALAGRFERMELVGAAVYAPNVELRIPDRMVLVGDSG